MLLLVFASLPRLMQLRLLLCMNTLLVSAQPRNVLVAIDVTYLTRHISYASSIIYVILHRSHMADTKKSQVKVSHIHEKMSLCKPYSYVVLLSLLLT